MACGKTLAVNVSVFVFLGFAFSYGMPAEAAFQSDADLLGPAYDQGKLLAQSSRRHTAKVRELPSSDSSPNEALIRTCYQNLVSLQLMDKIERESLPAGEEKAGRYVLGKLLQGIDNSTLYFVADFSMNIHAFPDPALSIGGATAGFSYGDRTKQYVSTLCSCEKVNGFPDIPAAAHERRNVLDGILRDKGYKEGASCVEESQGVALAD